jgi:hypothetical protein
MWLSLYPPKNMKLQLEIVKILLESIEKSTDIPSYQNVDANVVTYHLCLMIEGGLIKGMEIFNTENNVTVVIEGLTWEGHNFLANLKNPTFWNEYTICL